MAILWPPVTPDSPPRRFADNTAPTVSKSNPPNAFTGVPVNLMVQIQFSEPVLGSSISSVTLTPSGDPPLTLMRSLSNANQTLTLVPPALLAPSKLYTISITGVTDTAGNAIAAANRTFTTGAGAALAAPALTGTTPALFDSNVSRNIAPFAGFAAAVNPVSVTTASLYVYRVSNGVPVAGSVSVSADGKTITFTPAGTLAANTQYGFYMSGVTDMAGNTLAPFDVSFATGN